MPLAQVIAWAAPARAASAASNSATGRPQDEAAVLQHPRDRGVDIGLEAPVLCVQVDEGDGVAAGIVIGG